MTAVDVVIDRARARRQLRLAPATARALREQSGLTQADIAEALGVTRAAVSHWELGRCTPAGELARRYLDLLRRACGDAP